MENKLVEEENIKPDIKHDTMEFSPPLEGEGKLDIDDVNAVDEEITAEELDILEDEPDNEAYALNEAEMDSSADEDNLPDEDWTEDLGEIESETENKNHHRK